MDGVTFGAAIEAAKAGKRIARKGWNGKNMFVFCRPETVVPKHVVPKMNSLPKIVLDILVARNEDVTFDQHWCISTVQGTLAQWNASAADALSEDWVILD